MNQVTFGGRLIRAASMLASVSVLTLPPMLAWTATDPADSALQEIVVTGSRIVRDGYEAPTPQTVLGLEEIQAAAPRDLADLVNQIPAVTGGFTWAANAVLTNAATIGISAPGLRSLGSARTLTLLDGQRSVPVAQTGQTDISLFPQQLISRVDVVTGGASAVYGSDALAGVVNFVLDKTFTGIKGEVSGGATDYGDDANWRATLTGGFPFASGRGHILLSGEVANNRGLLGHPPQEGAPDRPWMVNVPGMQLNPNYTATNGQPQYLILPEFGTASARPGGIITSGPLRGTAFGPGGTPFQFNYGLVTGFYMWGGDYRDSSVFSYETLDPRIERNSLFGRVSFDITDSVNAYAQVSFSRSAVEDYFCCAPIFGTAIIRTDNPYIPASVAARAAALGVTQFNFGEFMDGVHQGAFVRRNVERYVLGAAGDLDLFGADWKWDAYFQKGLTLSSEEHPGAVLTARYMQAIDAVVNPATGAIVCRSTLTTPGNGCIPYNVFGIGVANPAARDWIVLGTGSYRYQNFGQDVYAASIRGEPFSSWAGAVSLATGVEHRREGITGWVDEYTGQWTSGNQLATIGKLNVSEAFLETVFPLAKDRAWARALDLNAAVRATDYSTSGYVTTWKVGASWSPLEDFRIRATRSRDIRAPNMQELFTPGTDSRGQVRDPWLGNASVSAQFVTIGNPDLSPEVADTTGVGIVLTPTFFPGFRAAVDYYEIDIQDSIGSIGGQSAADQCFAGETQFCSLVVRQPVNGVLTLVTLYSRPVNFVSEVNRGLDLEASYSTELASMVSNWSGTLSLRALATRFLEGTVDNGINPPVNFVGQLAGFGAATAGTLPRWRFNGSATYSRAAFTAALTGRGHTAGTFGNIYTECSTGCPVSTVNSPTINDNHVAGAFYLDASLTFRASIMGAAGEFFLASRNVFNKDPVIVAVAGPRADGQRPTNMSLYDVLGRTYRVGFRFQM